MILGCQKLILSHWHGHTDDRHRKSLNPPIYIVCCDTRSTSDDHRVLSTQGPRSKTNRFSCIQFFSQGLMNLQSHDPSPPIRQSGRLPYSCLHETCIIVLQRYRRGCYHRALAASMTFHFRGRMRQPPIPIVPGTDHMHCMCVCVPIQSCRYARLSHLTFHLRVETAIHLDDLYKR